MFKTPWQNLSIGNGTTYPLGYTWDVAVDYVITSGNVIINGASIVTLGASLVTLQPGFVATPNTSGLVLIRPTACSAGNGMPKIAEEMVNLISENELLLFPNPASDIINIEIIGEITSIELMNALGQKISNSMMIDKRQLNVSQLKPGVYIVTVTSEGKKQNARFVKM